MKKTQVLFLALGIVCSNFAEVADLVIFSYDRPLQLYALLESVEKHVKGLGEITVICRASDVGYKNAFNKVHNEFSYVNFVMQGKDPYADFKPLTLQATFGSPSPYVIFAVDDIVIKEEVDLSECITLLERNNAYGFYLRMGIHLNYCYTMDCAQKVPPLKFAGKDIYSWTFKQGECDWRYPNTVDMTLFRKKDLIDPFKNLNYKSPNTLESLWSAQAGPIMDKRGLCFKHSKIVNLPLNRIQDECGNRSMNVSSKTLLEKFETGMKLDIEPLEGIINNSAHMEYEATFIQRGSTGKMKKKDMLLKLLEIENIENMVGANVIVDADWYKKISCLNEKHICIFVPIITRMIRLMFFLIG